MIFLSDFFFHHPTAPLSPTSKITQKGNQNSPNHPITSKRTPNLLAHTANRPLLLKHAADRAVFIQCWDAGAGCFFTCWCLGGVLASEGGDVKSKKLKIFGEMGRVRKFSEVE
jgi:hypothetical protein